jgi:hypothetical protein
MPSTAPLTLRGAHPQISLAPHNSSEVLPSSSGSRKGLLRSRRRVMVLCFPLHLKSSLRQFGVSENSENQYASVVFSRNILKDLRFEVLMAVSMKLAVFWVVAPCNLVEAYWHF